jgi:hypothetical protein
MLRVGSGWFREDRNGIGHRLAAKALVYKVFFDFAAVPDYL